MHYGGKLYKGKERFKVEDNAGTRRNRCKRAMNKSKLEIGRFLLERCSSLQDSHKSKSLLLLRWSFKSYAVVACAQGNWNLGKSFPLLTGLTREIFGYNQMSFKRSYPSQYGHSLKFFNPLKESRDIV